MLKHLLHISILITWFPFTTRSQWSNYGTVDKAMQSFCAVADDFGNIHLSGGLNQYNYLGSSYHVHVARGGSKSVAKSRHNVRLKTIFFGWFMDVVGFACEGVNAAFYDHTVFYIGINDHTNKPKCFACDEDDICDDLSDSACTPYFGSCSVREGNKVYVIGGSRGVEVSREIYGFDLVTKTMSTTTNYGQLSQGVHHAGCTMVGNKLVIIGGGYGDTLFANRWQVCAPNSGCTLYHNLPNQVWNPQVVPNKNGDDSCQVLVMGGEVQNGATDRSYLVNACSPNSASTAVANLPRQLRGFSCVITNGLLCCVGGMNSQYQQSRDIFCQDFGAAPIPTRIATSSPTVRPTFRPTNPPSPRPTPRPTRRPTMRPTTVRPTRSPTPRPTHADDRVPVFGDDWKVATYLARGLSASACGVDPSSGDLVMAGGRQYGTDGRQTPHNAALSWGASDSLANHRSFLSKRTFPDFGDTFKQVLEGMYTPHQSMVRYRNKMYICSPQYWNPRNVAEFLKCEKKNGEFQCFNLCQRQSITCPTLSFSPCCVNIGRFLYWIGGSVGASSYREILKFDMEKDLFVSTDYGPLVHGTHAASCSVWNNRIYVFGGNSAATASGTKDIQICPRAPNACRMSSSKLPEIQTYGQAITIGSSMVIGCATGSNYDGAMPALYDAYTDSLDTDFNPGSALVGRIECCLAVFDGNLTALGGFQDDSVVSNGFTQMDRLRNCHNLIVEGDGTDAYDGSYSQVVVRSLKTSENVWRSYRNWIFYSDQAGAFWIWSSNAYCFSPKLKSGFWTSYAARGRRTQVDLTFTCNDEFKQPSSPPKSDPTLSWNGTTQGNGTTQIVVIVLSSIVGVLCLAAGCFYYYSYANRQREQLKKKAVRRVQSRSRTDTAPYGTITVDTMFPNAEELATGPQRMGTASYMDDDESTTEDSRYLEDDGNVVYDVEDRPGDVDESAYYYQQTKYTQDVLFPGQHSN